MATGSFARSSQPSISTLSQASVASSQANTSIILPYNRTKSRGRQTEDIDREGHKSKRAKLEGIESEALELLRTSIKNQASIGSRVGRVRLNTFELAIQLLQDEYESRLSESHFFQAVQLLQSESTASVFITLNSRLRDQWLCRSAGVKLLDELLDDIESELNI